MQRVSSGYTMIEVMIVLAISALLVVISLKFLDGSQERTGFSLAMRDVQSQFQDWTNDVTTGNPSGTSGKTGLSQIDCTVSGGKVMLKNNGGSISGDPGCIFLGKAIQVSPANLNHASGQDQHIYAYSIFGQRTDSSGELVQDIISAIPTPAVGIPSVCGGGCPDFTDNYTLGSGANVLSVKSTLSSGATGQSRMAGFFLSFSDLVAGSNGASSLKAYLYKTDNISSYPPGDSNRAIDDCLSLTTGSCKKPVGLANNLWPDAMSQWDICFGNNGNKQTAMLTLKSFAGTGVTTSLAFKACS